MPKSLDDAISADPLAVAPRKKEFLDQYAKPMEKITARSRLSRNRRRR